MDYLQTPDEKKIAAMFDGIAPRYDFLNHLLSFGQDFRWRRKLIEQITSHSDVSLLDVATGTGDVIAACLKHKKPSPRCVGIDISTRMLDLARRKLGASVALHKMSAEQLDFQEASFDFISIAFGLRNVIDKEKALQEFHRVLKKDGKLLVLEFFPIGKEGLAPLFSFYMHTILPRIATLFSDRRSYRYLPDSVSRFYRSEELLSLAADNGFTLLRKKHFLSGIVMLLVLQRLEK